MKEHLLIVFPHPDDETFGKAGTIALHTKAGNPATLVCGTLGQMGRNMGKPFFANRETFPAIREHELRDACQVLGIEDLRLLRLRDKTLEFEDPEGLADKVEEVIREVKPSRIMTYYPGHGVHPDHDALAAATIRAVARLPREQRPVVQASAVTRNAREVLGPPDLEVDVSPVVDIKLDAYRAHRSQSQGMLQRMEQRMIEDPEFKAQTEQNMRREVFWLYPIDQL